MSLDVVQLVAHSQYAWHLNETTKKQAELRLLVYGNLVLEPAEGQPSSTRDAASRCQSG